MSDVEVTPEAQPQLHGCPLSDSRGQTVVHPTRAQYVALMKKLLDGGYVM
ncbi:MAG: hypothetical protein RL473_1359, partial [Actinomycetota bacterium]